ncbi:MAG: MerR family DNA-binding protein [Myxococcales bacterium]|nr:MerR family DNA-binding protein [Myxococcales bacterium]
MDRPRTIGLLARETGVHVETIRYYERRGLLRQPRKASGRQRHYDDDARRVIAFIRRVQALGFSLVEIEQLLSLRSSTSKTTCQRVRTAATAKLRDVEEKMQDLSRIRTRLETLVATCGDEGTGTGCPLLAAFEEDVS